MEENNKDNINDASTNDSSHDDNRNDDNLNIYDQENDHKSPHESSSVTSIDGPTEKESSWKSFWTKKRKIIAGGIVVALVAGGGIWYATNDNDEDHVQRREVNQGMGQQNLPEARTIDGVGKGKFSAVDPVNGKQVNADIVGIDTTGDPSNAVLAPPEDISKIGWYVRSAPFGVDKGSTVLTSHIDYNGVVGLGTLFSSLKKGDPVTLTDGNGKQHHYEVSKDTIKINKEDPEYIKKTMNTVNKSKGENILVMITCGGDYDPSSPLGYNQNYITVAKLVDSSDGVKDVTDK